MDIEKPTHDCFQRQEFEIYFEPWALKRDRGIPQVDCYLVTSKSGNKCMLLNLRHYWEIIPEECGTRVTLRDREAQTSPSVYVLQVADGILGGCTVLPKFLSLAEQLDMI